MAPRLTIVLALLGTPAFAQDIPDPLPAEQLDATEADQQAYESAFSRFKERMSEFADDVRGIVDAREREERDRINRAYKAVQDELEESEQNYRSLAVKRFEDYLEKYPDSDYSPHVMFRLADLYYEISSEEWLDASDDYARLEAEGVSFEDLGPVPMKDYTRSIALYQKIIDRFPEYEYTDGALYMLGYCYADELSDQRDEDVAVTYFQRIVDEHAESDFAVEANLLLGEYYFEENDIEIAVPYYQRVVAAGETHSRYDKGVYKLAWAAYKLSDYDQAQELFTAVLDYSEELYLESGRESSMQPEALKFLAISFSDVADIEGMEPVEVGNAWFQKIGGRDYEIDVMKQLAEVLVLQARYESAIIAYEDLQARWPNDPDNPDHQLRIAQLYNSMPLPDGESSARAQQRLTELYNEGTPWWEANRANPDAQARARSYIEASLSSVARLAHQAAFDSGSKGDYLKASELYQDYLNKYPFADDYYEVTWYLADTYYKSDQFEAAIAQYDQLLKFDDRGYHDGSRYLRWKATRAILVNTHGDVYEVAKDAEVERTVEIEGGERKVYALSDQHEAYIERCEELQDTNLNDPAYAAALDRDRKALFYEPAYILFKHGDYEAMRPLMEEVIDLYPRTEEGAFAAGAIVNSYKEDGDLANLRKYAGIYGRMALGPPDAPGDDTFASLEQGADFKLAAVLSSEGQFEEAAEAFMSYLEKFPGSENENLALYNAANNYQLAGKNELSNQLFERYIAEYPTDERSEALYWRIAQNYEGILELTRAVDYYEDLYRNFPEGVNAASALYNAGFLRVGMGDYQGAAENFEVYVDRFPEKADIETAFWFAGENWARVSDEQAMAWRNRYLRRFPEAEPDHVIEVLYDIVKHYEVQGDERNTERAWEDLDRAYVELGGSGVLGGKARNLAAESSFRKLDAAFYEFLAPISAMTGPRIDILEDGYPSDEGKMTSLLIDEKSAELIEFVDQAQALITTYEDYEYTSAAVYLMGAAHLAYAEMFYNAPIPAAFAGDFEKEDIYRGLMDENARPLEDKGIGRLEANLQSSADKKRSSQYIDRTIELLNQYRPKDYPLEKPEIRRLVDSAEVPVAGPASAEAYLVEEPAEPAPAPTPAPTEGTP